MKKEHFPWLAVVIGLIMLTGLTLSGAFTTPTETALPLLTMLFMAELGGLVSAGGAFFAIRDWLGQREKMANLAAGILCVLLAIALLFSGLTLWQQNVTG